jgi:hypothetical protein
MISGEKKTQFEDMLIFRWLYNHRERDTKGMELLPITDWTTPSFVQIKEKRSKRISLI